MANEPRSRNIAKILTSPEQIEHLLGLPDGYRIVQVEKEYDPLTLVLIVEAPGLAPVLSTQAAPIIGGQIIVSTIMYNGVRYSSSRWEREIEQ